MDFTQNIYNIYSGLPKDWRKRLIKSLADEFSDVTYSSIYINWFTRDSRSIPKYRLERTLKIAQNTAREYELSKAKNQDNG